MCQGCAPLQDAYDRALAACEALGIHPDYPTFVATWNITKPLYTDAERAAVYAYFQAEAAIARVWCNERARADRREMPLKERKVGE